MGTDFSVPAFKLFTPLGTSAVDTVVYPHFNVLLGGKDMAKIYDMS